MGMADRLRKAKEYADTHRVFDLSVMNEAADLIEQLEEERDGLRKEVKTLEGYLNAEGGE